MRTAVGPRAAPTTVRRAFATRAAKKVEVVLSKDVQSLGTTGSIKKVSPGYFKNFLLPQGLAEPVTEQVMEKMKIQQERDAAAQAALKDEAKAVATALSIAKNFTIKKEANDENTYGRFVRPPLPLPHTRAREKRVPCLVPSH